MDHVDKILAQWNHTRPDLDVEPMGLLGRLNRVSLHASRATSKTFARYGLNKASFDVLATLRRSGAPYQLSPSDLLATMMVTSGTMTNRIDQLEKAGLVARIPNPEDGRGFIISLTQLGFEKIDAAVSEHVETLIQLTSDLSADERKVLNALLKKFLYCFEGEG